MQADSKKLVKVFNESTSSRAWFSELLPGGKSASIMSAWMGTKTCSRAYKLLGDRQDSDCEIAKLPASRTQKCTSTVSFNLATSPWIK